MTRKAALILVAVAAFACAKAEEPNPGRELLAAAVESMGGDAALAEVKGMRVKTTGTYQMGEMPAPFTAETVYLAPDRFLWQLDAGMFKASMGVKGETAWSFWMGPPARVKGPMSEYMKEVLRSNAIILVRPLLHQKGMKITGGGNEVRVEFPGGQTYKLTFSEGEQRFLTAMEGETVYWDGRKATMKMQFSEPKTFGDITLPSKLEHETFVDGKSQESMKEETTDIEWNPTVADAEFGVPAHQLDLMKPIVKEADAFKGLMLLHEGAYDKMGETISKIYAACHETGLLSVGGATAVFMNAPQEVEDPSELRTEIYIPVMLMGPEPESLPHGTALKDLEGGQMASMTARGPYGQADVAALQQLMAWVGENGYEIVGMPRTLYMHNPEMTVEEDAVSEVQIPVKKTE